MDTKQCIGCKELKPFADFHCRNSKYGKKPLSYCKPCQAEKHREWRRSHGWVPRASRYSADGKECKCSKCGHWFPLHEFPKQKKRVGSWCFPCIKRYTRTKVLRKYSMSEANYLLKAAGQGFRCAICLKHTVPGKPLCVDHCHTTGRVRDLLCHRCNLILGIIENASGIGIEQYNAYINKHREVNNELAKDQS